MARSRYQPAEFETKWQARWAEAGDTIARDDDPRPKYYNLVMFPYHIVSFGPGQDPQPAG